MMKFKDFLQRAKNTVGQSLPKPVRTGVSASLVFGRELGDTGDMAKAIDRAKRQLKKGPIEPEGKNVPILNLKVGQISHMASVRNSKLMLPRKRRRKNDQL